MKDKDSEDYSVDLFHKESQLLGKEVLQIAEWIIVVVAFSWAAEKAHSLALYYFAFVLYLLLGIHVAVSVNRFLRWLFPSIALNRSSNWRSFMAALVALAMAYGGLLSVDASFEALICSESATTIQAQCSEDRPVAERTLYPSWLR